MSDSLLDRFLGQVMLRLSLCIRAAQYPRCESCPVPVVVIRGSCPVCWSIFQLFCREIIGLDTLPVGCLAGIHLRPGSTYPMWAILNGWVPVFLVCS